LTKDEIRKIRDSTDFKVLRINNGKATLVSWSVFNDFPMPSCSNVIFINGKANFISLNGSGENNFGENTQYDSMCLIESHAESDRYVFLGSNGCGKLCVELTAFCFSLSKDSVSQCDSCFFDGKRYFSTIKTVYLINSRIKFSPCFNIVNRKIFVPVFSVDKTRLIGNKRFAIIFRRPAARLLGGLNNP
jgi:hypothetical protein